VAAELRLPENQQRHCLKIAAGIMHVSPRDCKRKMRVDNIDCRCPHRRRPRMLCRYGLGTGFRPAERGGT
jgi:hypothetical protein